jgi:hypothetical protein
VVQQASFFLRQHDHTASPIGESFKHGGSVSVPVDPQRDGAGGFVVPDTPLKLITVGGVGVM